MLRSLNSGVSGMILFQQRMDVIGNNIANVNTTGFKSARMDFADAFSQTYRGAVVGSGSASNTDPIQVGTGVTSTAIKNQFTQGAITRTGPQTDLAISGDGFFMVKDSVSGSSFATRAGDFRLDQSYRLVTNGGFRVQGFSDSALSTEGDILIDGTGRPSTADPLATVSSYSIGRDGKVAVRLSDGSEFVRGQILMQRFSDPNALTKQANNLYSSFLAAGPLTSGTAPSGASAPGTNGLGVIESGALELSNVDLANEFSNMIVAQRAFQANARIITTSDEMLQELVNLKR
jgi:flagellar hook protein FlgE